MFPKSRVKALSPTSPIPPRRATSLPLKPWLRAYARPRFCFSSSVPPRRAASISIQASVSAVGATRPPKPPPADGASRFFRLAAAPNRPGPFAPSFFASGRDVSMSQSPSIPSLSRMRRFFAGLILTATGRYLAARLEHVGGRGEGRSARRRAIGLARHGRTHRRSRGQREPCLAQRGRRSCAYRLVLEVRVVQPNVVNDGGVSLLPGGARPLAELARRHLVLRCLSGVSDDFLPGCLLRRLGRVRPIRLGVVPVDIESLPLEELVDPS